VRLHPGHLLAVTAGNGVSPRYPAESLDCGLDAVMVGARKCLTMQRNLGASVSAAGEGVKASPQASSLSDRSSILVGDLANVEFNATRKQPEKIVQSHDCHVDHDQFCYICSKFEVKSLRRPIDESICNLYEELFNLRIDKDNSWLPSVFCNACNKMLKWKVQKTRNVVKFSTPTIWRYPCTSKECYFCMNDVKDFTIKTKSKIVFNSVKSVTAPVPY